MEPRKLIKRARSCDADSVCDHKNIMTDFAIPADDFMKKRLLTRPMIIDPWLRQGTLTLLYAKTGLGKTWFSLAIAVAATRGVPIGDWKTINPVGCLYLDGEMACDVFQSRLQQLTKGLPPENENAPLLVKSSAEMRSRKEQAIDIGDEECRNNIYHQLKQNRLIRLLIIDNLSCLASGISDSSARDWIDIKKWLYSLSGIGVAVIVVHHTGKNGEQMGTSTRGRCMDFCIKLTEVNEYNRKAGATFNVNFDKARIIKEEYVPSFKMKIVDGGEGKLPWETNKHQTYRIEPLF